MRVLKKKCLWCPALFDPHPRLKARQKSCGGPDCVLKQRRAAKGKWRRGNRSLQRQMVRDWFGAHPRYLKTYRERHPDYREKNRRATRFRMLRYRFDKRNRYFPIPLKIREKPLSAPV